ncbi:hypothetical protein ACSU64_27860 [Bacillaceae bacterium C204]|uniref:hypothetical protein n=1 Tax=Neobacillus sp. 204 TaxID=3383351 RepID=UPI00397AA979
MAKKEKEELDLKAPKGDRINGKKASANQYIHFYEFLLYDPLYRGMSEKAKVLYCFLRKKAVNNKNLTELKEAGDEDVTRSYRDKNGEIFVIADNAELSIILQCHYNRVKGPRDELKAYGLLEEVPQFQKASHLYVLTPKEDTLAETWLHIEEMKVLRQKIKDENKAKAEKRKAKLEKEAKESSNEADFSNNQQNASYNNQQNVSYNNQQNAGQIINLKGSKSLSKGLNNNLNSLEEEGPPANEYKYQFSETELKQAYSYIAPQFMETLMEFNFDDDFRDRLVFYMYQKKIEYFAPSEYRSKRKEIELNDFKDKKGKKIHDLALYVVNGIKLIRESKGDDRRAYQLEKAKKLSKKQKEQAKEAKKKTESVPFYNWLEANIEANEVQDKPRYAKSNNSSYQGTDINKLKNLRNPDNNRARDLEDPVNFDIDEDVPF